MNATIDGKPVVSYLLLQEDGPFELMPGLVHNKVSFMAFETHFQGKKVFTGIGIGVIGPNGIKVTEAGARASIAMQRHVTTGKVFLCECRKRATARQRAISALKTANDGDGVFILCKDSKIYDEVLITKTFGLERRQTEIEGPDTQQ